MDSLLIKKRYTFGAVARLLNVHVATVWRWHLHGVRGRRLPTILVGARRFVLEEDLEAFLSAANPTPAERTVAFSRRGAAVGTQLDAMGVRGATFKKQ